MTARRIIAQAAAAMAAASSAMDSTAIQIFCASMPNASETARPRALLIRPCSSKRSTRGYTTTTSAGMPMLISSLSHRLMR